MKTNLSSQITLTRIPTKYYRPENAFEHSVLTRLEKVPTTIYESAEEGSFAIAKEVASQIRKRQEAGMNFILALPGGRSPETRREAEAPVPQRSRASVAACAISGCPIKSR